jgi:hypothetical protein
MTGRCPQDDAALGQPGAAGVTSPRMGRLPWSTIVDMKLRSHAAHGLHDYAGLPTRSRPGTGRWGLIGQRRVSFVISANYRRVACPVDAEPLRRRANGLMWRWRIQLWLKLYSRLVDAGSVVVRESVQRARLSGFAGTQDP